LLLPRPPTSTLSPYTTLFRSIGITPMLSIARYLDVHDGDFDLHYFARSSEEAAFLGLLQEKCPQKLHPHLGTPLEEHDALLREADRKSTRLNSSHVSISYAVF